MFEQRRKKFLEQMKENSVAVFKNSSETIRNNDVTYKHRTESDFYYLTGFSEPDSVLVLTPSHPEHKYILFVRPRDPNKETWYGKRAGVEGAMKDFGADIAYSIEQLDEKLAEYLKVDSLYYTLGKYHDFDQKIISMVSNLRSKIRAGASYPSEIIETNSIVHEMRLIKDSSEIEAMKKSLSITKEAYFETMKALKPEMFEYEIEAIFQNTFRKHNASSSYESIVGGGANATILHYIENNKQLQDGELLLIDAAAEYNFYASDITRTFPVSGKFTEAQKEIYNVVLKAQLAAIEMAQVGNRFMDVNNKAIEVLTQGLVDLGILKGDVTELIKTEAYKKFYMHKIGHWLGMDVHDVGRYAEKNGESKVLKSGIMMTIEPGLYIPEDSEGVDSKYLGIGIRIEDDILITKNGNENLSKDIPKTVEEIEALMSR